MKPWVTFYIGVGSNLHQPLEQAKTAIAELTAHRHLRNVIASPLYQSKPVGPQDQPDYINAVVKAQTQLGPHDVLDVLQKIENDHGRVRKRHWGERTLDLDLLLYGNAQIHTPRLTVPHSHMLERGFVLYPLADIAPQLILPNGQGLQQCLTQVEFDLIPVEKDH